MAGMIERGNVMDPELAIFLLSELDGMIQSDMMNHAPEEIVRYTDQEQELILRRPHDGIYLTFLTAMIRQAQGEYEGYNNAMESFNEKLETFREWYVAHYDPAETASREYMGAAPGGAGYGFAYLTAYGLAVKHGYAGTEEEWLASLEGQPGAPGEAARMRFDAERGVIQWGVEGVWYDLFTIEELKDPVVEELMQEVRALAEAAAREKDAANQAANTAAGHAKTAEAAAKKAEEAAKRAEEAAGVGTGGNGSGQNVELDATLSKSGAAAEAKAVGEALAKVGKPTAEQVATAVKGYLAENGVEVKPQWADFSRITNPALDIKNAVAMDERITIGTDGTLRHNLMIENALISWSESWDNTDNAAGDCHVKLCCWWDVFGSGHTDKTPNIRMSDVVDVFPAGSSILGVDGAVIDNVVASSDSCIIDCTGGSYIIGAICRGAATGYHMVYRRATVASNTITLGDTINVLRINGAEWDMSTLREDYTNPLSQINTRVISTGGFYYMAVVQSHVGVAILKSADGIDWTLANHIPDKDCYIEACIGMVQWSSNQFPAAYVAVRHVYGDGYISLYGLQAPAGAVMTETLIPAATGRPMLCGGFMDKNLYIAYSVNGRQNAVLGMIKPRSDGTTGISILTTPVGVMSNYPAMWIRESSNGEWFILFGGTDGMNTNKSAVSVAYLWNQDNPNIAAKNAKLRDLMFGDAGAVEDDTGSVEGGTGSWETLLDVTTTEEQWCIYQAFPTKRKLRRLRAYIETVGTVTNGSATRVLLVPYSPAATWYPNGLADSGAEGLMADATKKCIYMDADIMASCTMGSAWIQAGEKGGWSGDKIVGNRDTATKSSTEFAGIAVVPSTSQGTHVFGVGTRVVIEGY